MRTRTSARDDAGQVTVMIVGFFVVIALMCAVTIDASAAYLRRQQLGSLADGAALAAADGAQGLEVYEGGLGEMAEVDAEAARAYVEDYLIAVGARDDHPGLVASVSSDGSRVTVTLQAPLRLPISPPGWDDSTLVTGNATAVVPVV
jgi:uncharacterized membrane protein